MIESVLKSTVFELIKNILSPEDLKYLLSKVNSQFALSTLFKKVCNKRCVQKRKPFDF